LGFSVPPTKIGSVFCDEKPTKSAIGILVNKIPIDYWGIFILGRIYSLRLANSCAIGCFQVGKIHLKKHPNA